MLVAAAVSFDAEFGFKLGEFATRARKELKPTSIDVRNAFSILMHFKDENFVIDIAPDSITYFGIGFETWLKNKKSFFGLLRKFAEEFGTEEFERIGFLANSFFEVEMTRKELASLFHESLLAPKESLSTEFGDIYDGHFSLNMETDDYKYLAKLTSMNNDDLWTTVKSHSKMLIEYQKGLPITVSDFFQQFDGKNSVLNICVDLFIEKWKFQDIDRIGNGYLEVESDRLTNLFKEKIAP